MNRRELAKTLGIVAILIFSAAFVSLRFPSLELQYPLNHVEAHSEKDVSYMVFVEEGVYYAKNCSNGQIAFSGTDASTIMQSAINALGTNGGKIFIERGTYEIRSRLSLGSDLVLEGDGGLTILKAMRDLLDAPCMIGDEAVPDLDIKSENILIFDLTLDCNFVRMQHAVWLRFVQYPAIKNVFVREFTNFAAPKPRGGALDIGFVSTNGLIEGCVAVNCWSEEGDFHVCGPEGSVVNNRSYYALNRGILSPRGGGTVVGNTVIGAVAEGIVVDGPCSILDNYVEGCKYGIYVMDRPEVCATSIIGNVVLSSKRSGIYVNRGSNATIKSNICFNNGKERSGTHDGITLIDTKHSVLEGNVCFDNQTTKTQSYGISERGTSDYNLIVGNFLRGNLLGALTTVGANTIVKDIVE